MRSRWPFLDHPGVLAFAHRGGAGDWPENTMPAFQAAIDLGYRYLETDVHATSDGVLMAFHDDHLDRVTDGRGAIGELPYRIVRDAKVDGREPIPLLEDLLGAFPDARINIDPKHDDAVEPLIATLVRTKAVERVCCGAFSDERLARLRARLGPDLCTSLGPRATAKLRLGSFGLPLGVSEAPCVQVPVGWKGRRLIDARFVRTAHAQGLQVHAWTIDRADEMHELLDLGVDGLMTDHPALLKSVLTDRGQWAG